MMDREIELKFLIAPEAADEILSFLQGEEEVRALTATYFDTADHALRRAGFGLRVRDGEGGRKQTLKSASAGGIFARGEWETVIAGPGPDDAALAGTPAAGLLGGQALAPVFTTRVERQVRMIRDGDTVIEAVVDRGELIAATRRTAVCELELELKSGPPSALFDLARQLAQRAPLRLSLVSKAERGYGLVMATGTGAPRRTPASLDSAMRVGESVQAIGREALSHLCAASEALRERPGPDQVHQLRVAIRRLRSLLKTFKALAGDPGARALNSALDALAGELDAARELDVFIAEVWRPASDAAPSPPLSAFGRALLAAQTRAYLHMEAALEGPAARTLLLEAAAWLEAGPWAEDPALAALRDQPAITFAAGLLDHRLGKVLKGAPKLEDLAPAARHRLRLKVKTLRYAAEDLAALFPDHPRRIERFMAAAKAVQDTLGALNDQARAATLAHEVAVAHGDADAAFVAGQLTATLPVQTWTALRSARKALDELGSETPFWRMT
jgi:inorganic triphosphatase YgiF